MGDRQVTAGKARVGSTTTPWVALPFPAVAGFAFDLVLSGVGVLVVGWMILESAFRVPQILIDSALMAPPVIAGVASWRIVSRRSTWRVWLIAAVTASVAMMPLCAWWLWAIATEHPHEDSSVIMAPLLLGRILANTPFLIAATWMLRHQR